MQSPLYVSNEQIVAMNALAKVCSAQAVSSVKIEKFSGSAADFIPFITNFKASVENIGADPLTKLNSLREHVDKKTKSELRRYTFAGLGAYDMAVKYLYEKFGSPEVVAKAIVAELTGGDQIRLGDKQALRSFAHQIEVAIKSLDESSKDVGKDLVSLMGGDEQMAEVLLCLPPSITDKYLDEYQGDANDLRCLHKFLLDKTKGAYSGLRTALQEKRKKKADDRKASAKVGTKSGSKMPGAKSFVAKGSTASSSQSSASSSTNSAGGAVVKKEKCIACVTGEHWLPFCPKFKHMNGKQRRELLKLNERCLNCFRQHATSACPKDSYCKKENCTWKGPNNH